MLNYEIKEKAIRLHLGGYTINEIQSILEVEDQLDEFQADDLGFWLRRNI